ncbi:hypothetical protein C8R47DRAFT_1230927 [Mycena vitilis]|nr:hypothetical protein C8R47DRAFT_1230927 [Mycena vitilis]
MHRDPAVFPLSGTFLPERWLPSYTASKEEEESAADVSARRRGSRAWRAACSRICGGVNLAHLIPHVVLVPVLCNFEVEAATGTDEKSMEMRDSFLRSFVMFIAAMECKVIFHPRVPA